MSLILEALRKSEAERQRGRAPGLFVEQMPARAHARRAPTLWPWLLVAVLVATGLGWAWWQGRRPEPAAVADLAAPAAGSASDATPGSTRDAAIAPGAIDAPPTPAPVAPNSVAPDAAMPVSQIPDPVAATPPASERVPASPADTSPPIETASTADSQVIAPTPAPSPISAPPSTRVSDKTAPVVPAAPISPPSFSSIPAAAAADSEPAIPTVASLSAAERAQLPPLKLSMHVYADAPGQRFVILDGQRLGEGATPSGGIVLEQIRRDGIVLSVNGQRVLLKRP